MSKIAILISGDQVLTTQVVPDNTVIVWHNLGTQQAPTPDPVATLPTFLEQHSPAPAPSVHRQLPEPGSRKGLHWTDSEIEWAKSDRSHEEVAKLTGRTVYAVSTFRGEHGLGKMRRQKAKGVPIVPWTEEQAADLLAIAGDAVLSTPEYEAFCEFFPGRSAAALRGKHVNLLTKSL